jgi:uncharacterized membrane protein
MANTKHHFKEHWQRSLAKAITYRIIILILDFSVIYLITGRFDIAVGFTAISNVYSTVAYYLHERVWDRIKWGKAAHKHKG